MIVPKKTNEQKKHTTYQEVLFIQSQSTAWGVPA